MQQINLYVSELRPQRIPFAAKQIALALAVLVLVLIAIQGLLQWQGSRVQNEQRQAELRLSELQQRFQTLEQAVAQMRIDENLKVETARLAQQLENTRSLFNALNPGGSVAQAEQFSSVLEGLARQRQDGLWLTQIGVLNAGQSLELRGVVVKPELLPVYLQKLKTEPAFAGRQFNVLQLQTPEDRRHNLNFFISTDDLLPEVRK